MFSVSEFNKLKIIYIENFSKGKVQIDELYSDVLMNFQKNWDIERLDFGTMYDESLKSEISNRLWKGIDFFPKETMLKFIELRKEDVRWMFRDLYDENKDLAGRVSRFIFHCDQLFELLPVSKKTSNHYWDEAVVMTHLFMRYPMQYSLLDRDVFMKLMVKLSAKNIPNHLPITTYSTLMRTINKFLVEDKYYSAILEEKYPKESVTILNSTVNAYSFIQI